MPVLQRVLKPKTRKGKRILIAREPQIIEGAKQMLFLQGRKTSPSGKMALNDILQLKKPHGMMYSKKNDFNPFESAASLEYFSQKNDTPLFMMATHSKKRPNNLLLGRMFDHALLDMIELGIEEYVGLNQFKNEKVSTGVKPCLVFNGPAWEQSADLKSLKSLLIDTFQVESIESIRLQGLEHVLSFTATEDSNILIRSYRVMLKKSGQITPRVELEEIGPSVDLTMRRTKLATVDLMKLACKKPGALKVIKKKNISRNALGTTHGRIHLGKQQINKLQTRKMKGLKKTPQEKKTFRTQKRSVKQQSIKSG